MSLYIRGDFYVCPNPLSLDPYTLCEMDCKYCFIKEMELGFLKAKASKGLRPHYVDSLQKALETAFDTRKESKDSVVLALRYCLPVIIGRKCEPLGPMEQKFSTTLRCISMLEHYNVASILETKFVTTNIAYSEVLSGVLVSATPLTVLQQEALEPKTPTIKQRLEFAKDLKERGLWVGISIEPIIPTVSDNPKRVEEFADEVVKINPDHVNIGGYRMHNKNLAYDRMMSAGLDLRDILRVKEKEWNEIANRIFETFSSRGLKVSSPEWDLFGTKNACEGCCGLDSFNIHRFTFQHAARLLKDRKQIKWSDVDIHNIFGGDERDKFRAIWNGKKGYFNLSDIDSVSVVGRDENGDRVYGKVYDLEEDFS